MKKRQNRQPSSKILNKSFFQRDAKEVAMDFIGKYIVRKIGKKILRNKITEIEVYDGFKDRASHASRGKTKRNAPMFKEGGIFYVYLVYGFYYMLNVVTGEKDYPSAILIRGIEGVNGPGRLTKYLKVDLSVNGKSVVRKSGLWFEDGEKVFSKDIKKRPRIGISYAGPFWSKRLWRFVLKRSNNLKK